MRKILAAFSGLLLAAAAMATPIQQDTLELRLGGNIDFDNPSGKFDFLIDSGLGYFVLDDIEFGGLVTWGYNGNDFGYGIGGFGEYNFDFDVFIMPYIGMKLQYFFGDFYVKNFINVQFDAGLKFFLSEAVAIYTEFFYDLASENAYINGNEAKSYDVGMNMGIRAYF